MSLFEKYDPQLLNERTNGYGGGNADSKSIQGLPGDRMEPSFEPEADVIELRFRVKPNRAGIEEYKDTYPDFRAETPAEVLIREAIAAWDSEGLLVLFDEGSARCWRSG